MRKPELSILALMLLTAAGCVANERMSGPGLRGEDYAHGARARHYGETRVPAGLGLRFGVECDGR